MTTPTFQALIVDDEPISCKMMTFALTQEGFSCDAAKDGDEALLFCRHRDYDLVVTDLIMPNRNGHSLAVVLLADNAQRVVIVHTSVNEPRLIKDLLLRGVEEVVHKPTNYQALAKRAVALVAQRRNHAAEDSPRESRSEIISPEEISDIKNRLTQLSHDLPISQTAYDVYGMANSEENMVAEIVAAFARDVSLSADVLCLSNSFFGGNKNVGNSIDEMEEAILFVGQKRIGELALAASAFNALTANPLAWLNVDLAWHRSIAAAIAVDLLLVRGVYPGIGDGLFLGAFLHALGRIGLGISYPQKYQQIIDHCQATTETLAEHEERVFPLNPGEVLRCLFKAWNIPEAICQPFQYTSNSFSSLAAIKDPLRTKVELLKLAIFIGQVAVGKWNSWDTIEFPPTSVFKRLHIESLPKIIEDTRAFSLAITNRRKQAANSEERNSRQTEAPAAPIVKLLGYCNLSSETFDFLREIVSLMGITLTECVPNFFEPSQNFLINCLWNPPQRYNAFFSSGESYGAKLIVTDPNHEVYYKHSGNVILLPTSYGKLQAACGKIARHSDSVPGKAGRAGPLRGC
jgi:DNA-binding response OmpR family regulator